MRHGYRVSFWEFSVEFIARQFSWKISALAPIYKDNTKTLDELVERVLQKIQEAKSKTRDGQEMPTRARPMLDHDDENINKLLQLIAGYYDLRKNGMGKS